MLKVKDHRNLVRDPVSKAIIDTDETGYQTYLKKKESVKGRNDQLDKNSKDIEMLKNDISDIKKMLIQILESK